MPSQNHCGTYGSDFLYGRAMVCVCSQLTTPTMRNFIPGARRDRIVIAGHYDTKLFRDFPFVGASDGAMFWPSDIQLITSGISWNV